VALKILSLNQIVKAYKLYAMLRTRVLAGLDKFGRPILIERIGDFFSNDSASKALPPKLWCLCFSYDLAQLMQASRDSSITNKRLIHRVAYIGDNRGTSLWGAMKNIGFLRMLAKEVETHFPEILDAAFLPFASGFAESVWNMVKKFLDKKTAEKVIFVAGLPLESLDRTFGLDFLPKEYGGTLDIAVKHGIPVDQAMKHLGLSKPMTEDDIIG